MAAVTIRNLPDETHRALKQRAAKHGRSTEAEIRSILEAAVHPKERLKLGSAIVARVREIGGVELNIQRDRSPIEPPSFE
jgi:antitoxin FitA